MSGEISIRQIVGARAMLGMTQADLGAKIGLSVTWVANIERGASKLTAPKLRLIQTALERAGVEFLFNPEGVRLGQSDVVSSVEQHGE